jgi:UDP-N-acetyl-D-mannosaminuronic acid transferase (WecB/TagA/CpsF family)
MVTSTHNVAIFEEGFMLVDVNPEDIDDYGVEEMSRSIQEHDFVTPMGKPVVIVYDDAEDEPVYYGDKDLVDALTKVDYDDIDWGNELTLEWPTVTTTHPVATFEEGFILVGVHPDDIKAYGDKEMWHAVQEHDFISSKSIPVVIVYDDARGNPFYYGDGQIVDALAKMDYDKINWNEKLTLEWLDDES